MREYGQIQCAFWTNPQTQDLSSDGKLLACYLLTGPHSNGIGCYRLPVGYVTADLGWASETVTETLSELSENGFAYRCERTGFVWIPGFLRWNPVSNGNVATARVKEFEQVPGSFGFMGGLVADLLDYGSHWKEPFRNRLETLCEGYAKQEPTRTNPTRTRTEPDPTRKETGARKATASPSRDDDSDQVAEVFDHWRTAMRKSARTVLDDKRRRRIKWALKHYGIDSAKKAIDGCAASPFHMGDNDAGQRHDDLTLIFRNAEKTERFLEFANKPPAPRHKAGGTRQAGGIAEWLGDTPGDTVLEGERAEPERSGSGLRVVGGRDE